MKISVDRPAVETSGDVIKKSFTIKATSKAFQILSSGLYANKIRAIIRELSCNAWDSHKAAGKENVPIEVHLPTALDPTFYVKDNGIGLDDAGVTELYTTYFESTKADSNDFVGALGLGSKSPFSYTQSFNVEARWNGTKSTYTAFIDDIGTPAISRLLQVPTDEPNGLTVSLQVRREDVTIFENEAKYVFMYFKPTPNIVGRKTFKPFDLKYTISGKNWMVRETDYAQFGAYVVQGNVAYPIDVAQLSNAKLSAGARKVLDLDVNLVVPIGDVDVAASREALQYTKATVTNLAVILEAAAHDMHTTVQKEFDKCTSLWVARMKFKSFENNKSDALTKIFAELEKAKPFTYQGKKLTDELTLDMTNVANVDVVLYFKTKSTKALQRQCAYEVTNRQNHWNDKAKKFQFEFNLHPAMPVLIDDMYNNGTNDIVRQFLQAKLDQTHDRWDRYALVLRPTSKDVEKTAKSEIVKLLADLGTPDPLLISELGFVKTKKLYKYKKKDKNVLNVWTGFAKNGGYRKNQLRRTFSKMCFKAQEIELSDGGWYLPSEKFTIVWNGREQSYLDEILESAVAFGLIKEDDTKRLVAMNEKDVKRAKDSGGEWTNILSHIHTKFVAMNTNHELDNCLVIHNLVERFGKGMTANIIAQWRRKWRSEVAEGPFAQVMERVVGYSQHKYDTAHIVKLNNHFRIIDVSLYVTHEVDDTMAMWHKVLEMYEMFSLISWSNLTEKHAQLVVNYINTCEQARNN